MSKLLTSPSLAPYDYLDSDTWQSRYNKTPASAGSQPTAVPHTYRGSKKDQSQIRITALSSAPRVSGIDIRDYASHHDVQDSGQHAQRQQPRSQEDPYTGRSTKSSTNKVSPKTAQISSATPRNGGPGTVATSTIGQHHRPQPMTLQKDSRLTSRVPNSSMNQERDHSTVSDRRTVSFSQEVETRNDNSTFQPPLYDLSRGVNKLELGCHTGDTNSNYAPSVYSDSTDSTIGSVVSLTPSLFFSSNILPLTILNSFK